VASLDGDNSDTPFADLNRTILEVVLRDFESFESIVSKVFRSSDDEASEIVRRGLQELLADGLIEAYLIHVEPPYTTPVVPEPDNMQWYWYAITAQGRRLL
jgi:hypothetical protein